MTEEKKRIICIDYGIKRIGIAITDPLMLFASPLVTFENNANFGKEFLKLFKEYSVEKIILGYPLKESGEKSESTLLVEKFREELEKKIKIPIEYFDERYSSEIAKKNIMESVVSRKKRRDKSLVDKNAASVILQDYLDSIK
ncbi:MAG: Holliday junction resolvase RuvX [Ignavibacteria bacterium]|jgi:putative Holliday junction resolvase